MVHRGVDASEGGKIRPENKAIGLRAKPSGVAKSTIQYILNKTRSTTKSSPTQGTNMQFAMSASMNK